MGNPVLISASNSALNNGDVIAQIVDLTSSKNIEKISLNLTVTNGQINNFIVGSEGRLSFQASNFRGGRNTWVFQPTLHSSLVGTPDTSGTTIKNTLQSQSYISSSDAAVNAPYLEYDLFFDLPGVYHLWGRGHTPNGVYWSFGGDTTDMRAMHIGDASVSLEWTKFGQFFTEGGVNTFRVYLGESGVVLLDQFVMTLESDFQETLIYSSGSGPVALSKSPFNTAVRVRDLDEYGSFDDLGSSLGVELTSWLSSKTILASGRFNYILRNNDVSNGVNFDNGLFIEYWQVGGSINHLAAWDFNFVENENSVGSAMLSNDFGQTFQ